MPTRKTFGLTILIGLGLVVTMTTTAAASPPTVTVEKAIHFLSPAGEDVLVEPDTYQVETLGDSRIQLRVLGKEPLVIDAQIAKHAKGMEPPAMLVSDREDSDTQYLAIKLPNDQALVAPGSLMGVRSRRARADLPWICCHGMWCYRC